jgi:hypothetical protein
MTGRMDELWDGWMESFISSTTSFTICNPDVDVLAFIISNLGVPKKKKKTSQKMLEVPTPQGF